MSRTSLLLLPLALLAACSSTTPAATSAAAAGNTAGQDSLLAASHWTLVEATAAGGERLDALFVDPQHPVVLDFGDGRLSARAACNTLSGSYTLHDGTLQAGAIASTMIGCPAPLHAQDRAFGGIFEDAVRIESIDATRLVLLAADGSRLAFSATPTAQTRYGGPGRTVFLEVAAHTRPCPHPLQGRVQCLQVRELEYDGNGLKAGTPGSFSHFYDRIEGYTHEDGVRNVLRVKRFDIANPPADGSRHAWVHDMTVESELVGH